MRIHRTTPTRSFTTFTNALLRDDSISWCASGVLMYLLSLPDGAKASIRSLAAKRTEGRDRISAALRELEVSGYLRRVLRQNPETGTLATVYEVYDAPHDVSEERPEAGAQEVDRNLASGEPDNGAPGPLPSGEKTREQEPPSPAPVPPPVPAAPPTPAAALLTSLARREPRLALGAAEAERLAPLVEQWWAVGASDATIRAALTEGLPRPVHAPAALLADRLIRKLPAPPPPPPPAPAECEECRAPVAAGGACRNCAPVPDAGQDRAVGGFVAAARRGGAAARALLRGAPPCPA
ncbi:hypothetical protein [Streptomyces sp. NPDC059909]|uniref:hypothetical protein n=1 Tax=Streptomyces sp. NPDC059909 TaxID=3346998 RepID=UPI0036600895